MDCFVGFDAFIDQIIEPVYKRGKEGFIPFPSMVLFSEAIKNASGKSCNFELVVREEKIGGNGANLAAALVNFGYKIGIAGNFGKNGPFPIFKPLLERCEEVFSYEDPGLTDALEFTDGKIILGKLLPLQKLSHENVVQTIGEDYFIKILEKITVFVSGNWTMLPMTNPLWRYIAEKIAPKLSPKVRYIYVDLADPAKRETRDLKEAMELLALLNQTFQVILSLNKAEALKVADLMGIEADAQTLQEKLHLSCVVIHGVQVSKAAQKHASASHQPHFVEHPKIKTGAGDNFGAGFCHALLQNKSLQEAVVIANATATLYVQNGRSPSREELAIFLQACDNIHL